MFSQRTSTYRFLSGRDCSCQNPTPCISSCIIVPLWLQPGPSDSFWPTCVLQYWRPTADQHLISKIVVNIRLGLGMIDYEILLRDSELIAKMLKELCLDNIIFYKHSVTCCTELEKKILERTNKASISPRSLRNKWTKELGTGIIHIILQASVRLFQMSS